MEDVGMVAAWAVFGLVWWWLNRLGKKREWKWWQRHPLGVAAGFIALVIVVAVLVPIEVDLPAEKPVAAVEESKAEKPVEAAPEAPARLEVPTLNLSADEYLRRLNERLAVTDLRLQGRMAAKAVGAVNDTHLISVSQLHSVVLVLDKASEQVTSVMYTGQGDGSAGSGGNVMVVAITAMVAAAKDEPSREVSAAVLDLIANREGEDLESRTVGGVVVGFQSSQMIGSMFTAEPISKHPGRAAAGEGDLKVEG